MNDSKTSIYKCGTRGLIQYEGFPTKPVSRHSPRCQLRRGSAQAGPSAECHQARLVLRGPSGWPDSGSDHDHPPLARRRHPGTPQSQPRNGGRGIARPRPRRRGHVPGPSDRSPSQVSNGHPSPRARAEAVEPAAPQVAKTSVERRARSPGRPESVFIAGACAAILDGGS